MNISIRTQARNKENRLLFMVLIIQKIFPPFIDEVLKKEFVTVKNLILIKIRESINIKIYQLIL